jgi:hypothetical protein
MEQEKVPIAHCKRQIRQGAARGAAGAEAAAECTLYNLGLIQKGLIFHVH